MKAFYVLLILPFLGFSCQPPEEKAPGIGQSCAQKELSKAGLEQNGQALQALLVLHDALRPCFADEKTFMDEKMAKMYENHFDLHMLNTLDKNNITQNDHTN